MKMANLKVYQIEDIKGLVEITLNNGRVYVGYPDQSLPGFKKDLSDEMISIWFPDGENGIAIKECNIKSFRKLEE